MSDKPHKPAAKKAVNEDEIAALRQQIDDLTQALQHERADATNLRRRHDADMAGVRTNVKSTVVADLLPIADNLERALKYVPEDLAGHDYTKGVQGVVKQFEKTFKDLGVERIATVNQPFDPNLHEAISMEEGDGQQEIVSEELQAGYKIGDNVVRHAMVRVKMG